MPLFTGQYIAGSFERGSGLVHGGGFPFLGGLFFLASSATVAAACDNSGDTHLADIAVGWYRTELDNEGERKSWTTTTNPTTDASS